MHSQKILEIKIFENTILELMPKDQDSIQKFFDGHGQKAKKFCLDFKLTRTNKPPKTLKIEL